MKLCAVVPVLNEEARIGRCLASLRARLGPAQLVVVDRGSQDHAFAAVTGPDGSFRIDNVPAGKYKLEVWHEKLGTKVIPVMVSAESAAQADLAW
jgi:hypothetical protein